MSERTVDYPGLIRGLGALGWFAVAMLVLAIIVAVRSAAPLGLMLVAGAASEGPDAESLQLTQYAERFEEGLERDTARFEGRSVFFVPPAPIPPPPERQPEPPRVEREPVEPRDPPPPTRYGGPDIAYVWDDRVAFENDMTLTVGGEGQSGVEVLSMNLPWSVKLRWSEVEFDVPLFERTTSDFLVSPSENNDQAGERSGEL